MDWLEKLPEHITATATAIGALTAAVVVLGGALAKVIRDLRAAYRGATEAQAEANIAIEAAVYHRSTLEGTVASVDSALRSLGQVEMPEGVSEAQRQAIMAAVGAAMKAGLREAQGRLGIQPDVARVVREVRQKAETPETGIRLPEGEA